MIPGRFAYAKPSDPAEAFALLNGASGESAPARVLSGGTWRVPKIGRRELEASLIVDLKRAGLNRIEVADGSLHLGAACSYTDVRFSAVLAREAPLLVAMANGITGGRQIQSQGTLGGSACQARPSSDAPTALVGQGGEARILGADGERRIPVDDFFLGPERNALAFGELLTGFELRLHPGASWGYYKLKHSASSWPIATAAARVELGDDGTCGDVDLVLGGVNERPLRVDVAAVLVGQQLTEERLREAADLAREASQSPYEDELADAEYRLAVAAPTALRALLRALPVDQTGGS